MLTTGTPLLTLTKGLAPGTLLSTEIGRVCASTGDQTCVKTTDHAIRERSLDIIRIRLKAAWREGVAIVLMTAGTPTSRYPPRIAGDIWNRQLRASPSAMQDFTFSRAPFVHDVGTIRDSA